MTRCASCLETIQVRRLVQIRRRLQFPSLNSIVCSSRARSRASELSRIVSNAVHVSGQAWRKSLMEFPFSIVRSEEGRGFRTSTLKMLATA
jgi:hypothetical protein